MGSLLDKIRMVEEVSNMGKNDDDDMVKGMMVSDEIVRPNCEIVRNSVMLGDCLELLKLVPDNTFTAVVTDPPYGLSKQPDMREVLRHWLAGDDYEHRGSGFMGKSWDAFVPGPKVWEQVMRTLKPGGHILSFFGTRTYDLGVTAMRIAGAEIRDKIDYHVDVSDYRSWVCGSGFPKSMDIGKQLDKMGGVDEGEAQKWDGYGTALKPAHEPVVVVSKADENGEMPVVDGSEMFKYQAKAGKKERNRGCSDLYWLDGEVRIDGVTYRKLKAENESRKGEDGFKPYKLSEGNVHPTVKPLSLSRYLARMVKMPGDNLILDPFCGSGTVLLACLMEGCDFIGMDDDPMSVEIANARLEDFHA